MTPIQSITDILGTAPDEGDTLEELGLDMIDLWRVRDDLERAHGIEIACHTMMAWRTVADITSCLSRAMVTA